MWRIDTLVRLRPRTIGQGRPDREPTTPGSLACVVHCCSGMSELIVMAFDDEQQAKEVRASLLRMQKEHLVDLEDAAVVVKTVDGRMRLEQIHDLPLAGAVSGTFWGLLIGMLLAAPLVGAALGAGTGAIAGALADIGVDDDFMREVGSTLPTGSSALFILVRKLTPDKMVAELRPFEGRLLRTSLSTSDEEELRRALESARVDPTRRAPAAPVAEASHAPPA